MCKRRSSLSMGAALVEVAHNTGRLPALEANNHPAAWRPATPLRIGMSLLALAVAYGVDALAIALQPDQWQALRAGVQSPATLTDVAAAHLGMILYLILAPIIIGLAVYHGLRVALLVAGWRRYLARLGQDLNARLAVRARLTPLGYTPLARGSLAGTPGNLPSEPLDHLLNAYPRLLLTGEDGAGKTIALYRHCLEIARAASIGRIMGGRQIVPIIVPLSRYALAEPAADGMRLGQLADVLRQYGARMLAGQLPHLLRRGRVMLLFDGLDELTAGQAQDIVKELNTGLRQRYRNVRIIITCRSAVLNDFVEHLPLLKHLPQVALLPLAPDEVRDVIRRAGRLDQIGGQSIDAVLSDIDHEELLPIFRRPALLAMLIDLLADGQPAPRTRAKALAAYEELLFKRAGVVGARVERAQRALGYLALAFKLTGATEITGAQAWNERDAVKALLSDSASAVSSLGSNTRPLAFDEAQIVEAIDLGCMAGVLERGHHGIGLRFRHTLLLHLAAARHLDVIDSGLGRVSARLLRPEWTEIVILWGGLTADPAGLADRLNRLATTPSGTAASARMSTLNQGEPLALGLALTVALLSLVPVAVSQPEPRKIAKKTDQAQHTLREIFDRVLRFGVENTGDEDERRERLRAALRICESGAAGEFTAALARLVREVGINRLLRAQAVQVLGLLASPPSLTELTALLLEPDPIVREALQRGFHLAGGDAVEPLLDLMARYPATETIHRRALEALAAVDGPAVLPTLNRLQGADPVGRAVAAEALGALHDRRALDLLMAALKDNESAVRVAATRALGRLGDQKAQGELLSLLQSTSEEQRIAAVEALGILRGGRALKPLIKLLDDKLPKVRAAAAEALGHIGDARAVDPLRKHLADKDAWAQAAAATALRALGQRG